LRLDNYEEQISLWKKIIRENISVRQLEDLTKSKVKLKKRKKADIKNENDTYLNSLEEKLRIFFGTKVQIKTKTKNTGEIIIDYYSDDDLERILEKCE
jgi:ParB family chromosome partitioning protein